MPAVDHERVLVKLKAKLAEKPSHSARELFEQIAKLEADCEIPEDQQGFDGVPVRRQHPVEHIDNDADLTSNETPAEALA